jgi:peptidoglycan/LPS O-acetylase OafA/YrhL
VALPTFDTILSTTKLPGLDGFRMLAVLAVMVSHAGFSSFFSARHGVAGFFVLSGFLITWLLLKEHQKEGRISLKNFYIRRSLRIFPAYYAFLLVSVSWDIFRSNPESRELILPALFYYVNYHNALHGHSNSSLGHLWSLAVEEQFYLLWPVLFIFLMTRGRDYALRFLLLSCLAVLIWRTYAFSVLNLGTSYVYNAFDTRFDNLAIGCGLAFLFEKARFRRIADRLSQHFLMPLITLALLTVSLSIENPDYEYGPAFTIDAALLTVFLIQVMRLSHGRVWGWLNNRLIVFLGVISYPTYLWHGWGLQAGAKISQLPGELELLLGIILSYGLACGSYFVIEKRFLMLKRRFEKSNVQK